MFTSNLLQWDPCRSVPATSAALLPFRFGHSCERLPSESLGVPPSSIVCQRSESDWRTFNLANLASFLLCTLSLRLNKSSSSGLTELLTVSSLEIRPYVRLFCVINIKLTRSHLAQLARLFHLPCASSSSNGDAMEQNAAAYQQHRNASAAAAATETPDARLLGELVDKQDNVPGFLLLDAMRFYKKGVATHHQLAPAVETLQNGYNNLNQKMDGVVHDNQTSRARFDTAESRIQQADEAMRGLDDGMRDMQRDLELLFSTTRKHTEDISNISEEVKELRRQSLLSQARDEDRAKLRTEKMDAVSQTQWDKASQAGSAEDTDQNHSEADAGRQGPASSLPLDALPSTSAPRFALQPQRKQPAVDSHSSHSPPQPEQAASQRLNEPKGVRGPRQELGASSSSLDIDPRSSSNVPHSILQPDGQQPGTAGQGEKAGSEILGTGTASDGSGGKTASSTPSLRNHVALREHLKRAVKQHAKHPRTYPRITDIKFMWAFIDKIEDRELSKQLQVSLLNKFDDKLVRKSRAGARLNRFITFKNLKWPLFAQGVAEFLKSDDCGM